MIDKQPGAAMQELDWLAVYRWGAGDLPIVDQLEEHSHRSRLGVVGSLAVRVLHTEPTRKPGSNIETFLP